MHRVRPFVFPLLCAVLAACIVTASPWARAGPFVSGADPVVKGTGNLVTIAGIPGETFQISYVDAGGVARTKTVTLVRDPRGTLGQAISTVPAAKGTTISIKNLTQPNEPVDNHIAQRFTPGSDRTVTEMVVDAGSTLTAFGQNYALGGRFTTVTTTANYDIASPGYGTLGGSIPSSFFDVFATLGGEQIMFDLDGSSTPFSMNVAAAWDSDMPEVGIAVAFSQLLSGNLVHQGVSTPFTGSFTGSATFFPDNVERLAGRIVLDGIGSGDFFASGRTTLIAEPGTLALIGIALAGMGATVRRRYTARALPGGSGTLAA